MFVMKYWNQLAAVPGGKWIFSKAVGQLVPYTGSIGAIVEELKPGYCKASIKEKRALRNHFKSIHAAALMNFAEMVSGLAMTAAMPKSARGIPTEFHIEYLKKARGTITAVGECEIPEVTEKRKGKSFAKIYDEKNQLVCQATATWTLEPKP